MVIFTYDILFTFAYGFRLLCEFQQFNNIYTHVHCERQLTLATVRRDEFESRRHRMAECERALTERAEI
jgi:hypothetical protein